MLNERHRTVLFELIRAFVETGEPVSSAQIAQSGALSVSSATIRNVLGELEGLGLLRQPHVSAGRIPTPVGLRLYVEELREEVAVLSHDDPMALRIDRQLGALGSREDAETLARTVGGMVSQVARMTSILTLPTLGMVRLEDLHLSALSERRVLAMLVTSDEQVHQRVVQLEQELSREQLRKIEGYLSELTLGLTLEQVRERVQREKRGLERQWEQWVACALEIGEQALPAPRPSLYVEGKLNVFEYAELTSDVERLKQLLALLEEKGQVLELLDRLLEQPRSLTVLIGPELEWDLGDDLSLVVCRYQGGVGSEGGGVLGVLGPSRMDYARIIPLMRHTAQLFSACLARVQPSF